MHCQPAAEGPLFYVTRHCSRKQTFQKHAFDGLGEFSLSCNQSVTMHQLVRIVTFYLSSAYNHTHSYNKTKEMH